jgi:hypothetical protein
MAARPRSYVWPGKRCSSKEPALSTWSNEYMGSTVHPSTCSFLFVDLVCPPLLLLEEEEDDEEEEDADDGPKSWS